MPNQAHDHSFGQDKKRPGENRTLIVIAITAMMMALEIVTGIMFGSMALLADGLHMASHAAALTINALAYYYVRRHSHDPRFSFGAGKINALGGFTGAILLAGFALLMVWESFHRLLNPVEIIFNQAIVVAFIGLVVNGVSVFILGDDHLHDHEHKHSNEKHGHEQHAHGGHDHDHGHHHHHHHGHDHNLKSAYLHVLADALTSVLAILALFAGKYFGWIWMDPVMGILGAVLVSKWAWGLICSSGAILLDCQGPVEIVEEIRSHVEADEDCQITDLHLWSIGPGIYSLILAIDSKDQKDADYFRNKLSHHPELVHVTVEVNGTKE